MSHLLLINLGLGATAPDRPPYATTTYTLPDGFTHRTALAGLALWKWLDALNQSPSRVAFVATDEAWKQRGAYALEQVAAAGVDPKVLDPVPVPARLPRSPDDLWRDLGALELWLGEPAGDDPPTLHIDLTHAFRAIPIAQGWMAQYLANRGLAHIGVLGYGVYEGSETTPLLDLRLLVELAEWAAAVRDFRERLDPSGLSRQLEGYRRATQRDQLGPRAPGAPEAWRVLNRVIEAAREVGEAFPAGLPLELGLAVQKRLGEVESIDEAAMAVVLPAPACRLVSELHQELRPLATAPGQTAEKVGLALTSQELRRQLNLVRRWVKAGLLSNAFEGLREVIVNRVLLARGCAPGAWLSREARESAEAALRACANPTRDGADEAGLSYRIGRLWLEVCGFRNGYAHAGMQANRVHRSNAEMRLTGLLQQLEVLDTAGDTWRLDDFVLPR